MYMSAWCRSSPQSSHPSTVSALGPWREHLLELLRHFSIHPSSAPSKQFHSPAFICSARPDCSSPSPARLFSTNRPLRGRWWFPPMVIRRSAGVSPYVQIKKKKKSTRIYQSNSTHQGSICKTMLRKVKKYTVKQDYKHLNDHKNHSDWKRLKKIYKCNAQLDAVLGHFFHCVHLVPTYFFFFFFFLILLYCCGLWWGETRLACQKSLCKLGHCTDNRGRRSAKNATPSCFSGELRRQPHGRPLKRKRRSPSVEEAPSHRGWATTITETGTASSGKNGGAGTYWRGGGRT